MSIACPLDELLELIGGFLGRTSLLKFFSLFSLQFLLTVYKCGAMFYHHCLVHTVLVSSSSWYPLAVVYKTHHLPAKPARLLRFDAVFLVDIHNTSALFDCKPKHVGARITYVPHCGEQRPPNVGTVPCSVICVCVSTEPRFPLVTNVDSAE